MRSVTVGLCTYRSSRNLEIFLHTLAAHAKHEGPVLVWDNNADLVEQQSVRNILSRFPENWQALGEGYNLFGEVAIAQDREPYGEILRRTTTPFLCLAQDDMVFTPASQDFFPLLVETASAPEVGQVSPCSDGLTEGQNIRRWDLPERFEAGFLHGCFTLGRTDVYRSVGGWSGRLFRVVDYDMCVKLQRAGYKLVVDRRAYIHHAAASTLKAAVPNWGRLLLGWMEQGTVDLIRQHGFLAVYASVFQRHDGRVQDLMHGWSWQAMQRALEHKVPEWKPDKGQLSLDLEGGPS